MSPKQQNSPKNDLTEVHGLKRLMRTPRKVKEPVNDLSNVEGVASVFNISGVQRLSNESDIENNEDLFDKLFAKKPLRTYRGKSVSPERRKAMLFDDHRKTLGDTPLTSPRVTKWIEEQAVIRLEKVDENKDKVFEDGQVVQDKQIDNQLIEKGVDSPKGTPRGRRRVGKSEPKEETVAKNEKEVLVDKTEQPKRIARSRKKVVKAVEENISETANKDGNAYQMDEKANEVIPDEEIEFKPRKALRGTRKGNKEQLEKQTVETSDKMIVDNEENTENIINEVDSTSVVTEFKLPPSKRGRPRKASHKDVEDQIAEVHSTTEEKENDASTDTEIIAVAPKLGRGRPRNTSREEKADVQKTVPKRGRDRTESKEEVLDSPSLVRGRRAAGKDKEKVSETEVTPVIEHVLVKRGRRRNLESVDVDKEKGSKETKVVNRDDEVSSESDSTPIGMRKTRGRKEHVVEKVEENVHEAEGTPVAIEQVPAKRSRRKHLEREVEDNKGSRQTTAVNRVDEEASIIILSDPPESDNTPVATRKKRGRKEAMVEMTHVKRAVRNKKPNENIDPKATAEEVAEEKNVDSRSKNKSSEEVPKVEVVKKTRGRKAVQLNEEATETKEVVKKGRGRKKIVDTEGTEEEPINTAANNVDIEKQIEVDKVESPEIVKKPSRGRKKVIAEEVIHEGVKETEPARSTRSRKEPVTKEANSSKETKVLIKETKRTTGKVPVIEVIDIDSPRTTRAKRGNFKKYGSEFEMPMEKKKSDRSKKAVHFEETEKVEDGTDKKRKGRNATSSEEIEQTSRKSKRTRK